MAATRPIRITIDTYGDRGFMLLYIPSEKVWAFSKRAGILMVSMIDASTNGYAYYHCGKWINTFENRNKSMHEVVEIDPRTYTIRMGAALWYLRGGQDHIFWGNATAMGGIRDICAICLAPIETISSGREDNPLISTTLKCGHAFHQGCFAHVLASSTPWCPFCGSRPNQ